MKKFIAIALAALMVLGVASCASKKHHGYVSKYPNHHRHPCDH